MTSDLIVLLSTIAFAYVMAFVVIVFFARVLGELPWRDLGRLLAFTYVTSTVVIATIVLFSFAVTGNLR